MHRNLKASLQLPTIKLRNHSAKAVIPVTKNRLLQKSGTSSQPSSQALRNFVAAELAHRFRKLAFQKCFQS
ncbi:unnamed protein product [Sphagnum troendelagicum]|uniref:Uncharacterized protein n=1 Tax=Sphagnum troendelagicum TaxID=128251 RepID=A0ABP0TDQ7_9BRYO